MQEIGRSWWEARAGLTRELMWVGRERIGWEMASRGGKRGTLSHLEAWKEKQGMLERWGGQKLGESQHVRWHCCSTTELCWNVVLGRGQGGGRLGRGVWSGSPVSGSFTPSFCPFSSYFSPSQLLAAPHLLCTPLEFP